MPFDPCREWLGIDAADLVHPHRVLGIPVSETDADTIARVAEERIAQLARIAPGPFAKAHAALITRVAEARDTLLATATWDTSAESVPDAPVFSPPPPPMLAAAPMAPPPTPSPPPLAGSPPPFLPAAGAARVSSEQVAETSAPQLFRDLATAAGAAREPTFEPLPIAATVFGSRAPSDRRTAPREGGPGLGYFAVLLAAAAVVGYVVYRMPTLDLRGLQIAMHLAAEQDPAASEPAAPAPLPGASRSAGPPPAQPLMEPADPITEQPTEPLSPQAAPEQAAPEAPMEARVASPPEAPMPDPEAERRMAAERDRIAEVVSAALDDAYHALQRGEFDTADRVIESASKDVGDDAELATRIERWRLLASYASAFEEHREKAFASANSGREYEIDGRLIAIIEITPTMFIYRLEGKNVRKPRDEVHPRVEMAVVEKWFEGDGRATNFIFMGARWLCFSPPNVKRARDAWQKARDGGEDVSALLALLDDPIVRRAEGQ